MSTTANKKYLFVGGDEGQLKRIDLVTHHVSHGFGQPSDGIIGGMATTYDNQYLFTHDGEKELNQYRIDDHQLIKEYKPNHYICSVVATFDNRHVFVGLDNGCVYQICVETQKFIKCFEKIHHNVIPSMAVTRNSLFLITSSRDGDVKK